MTPDATDLAAQLTALKQTDSDTVFVTTGVEQITLVAASQAVEQRLRQAHRHDRRLSFPDQLIANPLPARPRQLSTSCSSRPGSRKRRRTPTWPRPSSAEWNKKGCEFAGLTEGFRGYDAIQTIVAAIRPPARPSRRRSATRCGT